MQSIGTLSWSGAYGNTWFIDPKVTVVAFTSTAFEGLIGAFTRCARDFQQGDRPVCVKLLLAVVA